MIPNVLYTYPDADRPVLASIRDHKFYAECVQQNPVHRMMSVNVCLVTLKKSRCQTWKTGYFTKPVHKKST